ncbi:50S ribosomal protein L32e [archaeon]|jgi:large subunit ribosomal protein L32e|nr:50S ribosomal protein L32e [archaeon]MBT4373149.1 50S ribosomal protein L32e [archaeon]MBT4531494.1 50S ribosomal protein L32e [archaeon]MBT7001328.1 50S ribosomal protein L32e [archaeon]MBT7282186.1 50S ribosomal protein L32e [archaeon]
MVEENKTIKKKKPKFLRRDAARYVKLGKRTKKNQKWRRPTGRDNKMREQKKGYPAVVAIGYKKGEADRIKIETIENMKELENVKSKEITLASIGKKKKIELVKKAKELGIKILNLNEKKFLKKNEKKESTKKAKDNKK